MDDTPPSGRRWHDRVYLSLGANLGDREGAVRKALAALAARDDIRVLAVAPFRETSPVSPHPQPDYVNTACRVATTLPAEALVIECQHIERRFGRDRLRETLRWGPRALDIDLILYDDAVLDTPVVGLPHREYRRRAFVLDPLLDLAPNLTDPETGIPLRVYRARVDDA